MAIRMKNLGADRKLAIILATVISAFSASASAGEVGNWTTGYGQGHLEYTVHNGPGNRFTFDCDEGGLRKDGIKTTNISTTISGDYPKPNSVVKAFADGAGFDLMVDKLGEINTDCHVCASTFSALWTKIRESKQLIIVFSDGRYSTYDARGARKVLNKTSCETGFASY